MYAAWRHESESDPEGATQRLRAAREDLFRAHPQTPLKPDDRARFGGLSYFPYDPAYRMTAVIEPAASSGTPASSALSDPAAGERYARVLVSADRPRASERAARRRVLPVFWMAGYAGGLFVPFRDATSGRRLTAPAATCSTRSRVPTLAAIGSG